MPSTETPHRLDAASRALLLGIAGTSIRQGVEHGSRWEPDLSLCPPPLREPAATFVTLEAHEELRGCIGTLEARRSLANDVAGNAYAAAFQDPRFPPLTAHELPRLALEVSVLSPPAPLSFSSEADVLSQLRPGIDGLILEDAHHRGTFLPTVWEALPAPDAFLAHLKRKAGLPPTYWSEHLRVLRYTTESFGAPLSECRSLNP